MELSLIVLFVLLSDIHAAFEPRCYYDAGKLASDDIIPCYTNSDAGQYACCKIGSKCLGHEACWDPLTQVTYQYGCTDISYDNLKCPRKCGLDRELSHWAGLVFCNGGNGTPKDTWLCHHPENCGDSCDHKSWDPHLERPGAATCKDLNSTSTYRAFNEKSVLQDVLFLPSDAASVSAYLAQHASSTSGIESSTSSIESSTSGTESLTAWPTSGTLTSTTSAVPSSAPGKKNHIATFVALGIGIPFGLVALGGLAFFLRKHRKAKGAGKPSSHDSPKSGSEPRAELPTEIPRISAPTSTIETSVLSHSPRTPYSHSTTAGSPLASEFSAREENRVSELGSNPVYELAG